VELEEPLNSQDFIEFHRSSRPIIHAQFIPGIAERSSILVSQLVPSFSLPSYRLRDYTGVDRQSRSVSGDKPSKWAMRTTAWTPVLPLLQNLPVS
jgi:hypothetical protein